MVRGKNRAPPPLAAVEEVVQDKLMEERTRRARELNLKERGLPLPHPSPDPMEVGNLFLRDTLDIFDVTLDRAWVGYGSISSYGLGQRLIDFVSLELGGICFISLVGSFWMKISLEHNLWSLNTPENRLWWHNSQGNEKSL